MGEKLVLHGSVCKTTMKSGFPAAGLTSSPPSYRLLDIAADLKDAPRAADDLIGNTSPVVLNFAWSH